MTVSTAETAKKLGRTASDACYSLGEEIANAVTHGVAALLSIAGLCVLVAFAANYSGSAKVVTAVSIFGASMVLLYTASTLYHAIPNINAKRVLQILDHSMIYVLIAGSYTPFCLITLKGWVGIALCIAVWTIAVVGVSLQKILLKRSDWINCVLYLAMGWLVVLAFDPLVTALPEGGLWLLVAGGIAYSVGVIFYIWEKLPYGHAIWHVFVFLGTALQFFSVLLYVIPGVLDTGAA
ncbi:PAQR family membrane homeostasis protein TrhA [Duodenibacillus massiliensis]|uniref:PAQR family membrane homeostasis protein TrhA n=1 Tax=Duodenibacillus massiliensis TaxID=1852381 RepID=UPI00307BBD19